MKLIRLFLFFVLVSFVIGVGLAFNTLIPMDLNENSSEKIIQEQEIPDEIVVDKEDEEVEDSAEIQPKKPESNSQKEHEVQKDNPIKQDKPVVESKKDTSDKKTEKEQSSTNLPSQPKEEEKIGDQLGITENEYYNSPMLKWQHVTHSSFSDCQKDGEEAIKIKTNPETGESYQEHTNYWCYEVNSYSGKSLGIMLSLE